MVAHAVLFLNDIDVNFASHFPSVTEHGDDGFLPDQIEVRMDGETFVFNVLFGEPLARQVASVREFIAGLDEEDTRLESADAIVKEANVALELEPGGEWEEPLWQMIGEASASLDAVLFAFDSIILPSGVVLAGPLRESVENIREAAEDVGGEDGLGVDGRGVEEEDVEDFSGDVLDVGDLRRLGSGSSGGRGPGS
jgi:hypothetical protein